MSAPSPYGYLMPQFIGPDVRVVPAGGITPDERRDIRAEAVRAATYLHGEYAARSLVDRTFCPNVVVLRDCCPLRLFCCMGDNTTSACLQEASMRAMLSTLQ